MTKNNPNQTRSDDSYPPISDYAIIGDCRCVALISKAGSIDWLCLPRFDSPSVFAALLDRRRGGYFAIRPLAPYKVKRRYVDHTNVLETTFTTETGVVRLTDLMPVYSEEDRHRRLVPERQILRAVECTQGSVEIEISYQPRLDYGRVTPRLEDRRSLGFFCAHGGHALILRSEIDLTLAADRSGAGGRVRLGTGERRRLSVSYVDSEPAVIPLLGAHADEAIAKTIGWWKQWSARCAYEGPFRDAVIRSALVLKLMTFAPSGAVVAAATTSLPEIPGGTANWDYRFCWLRDASMTVRAFLKLGYPDEGRAFLSWLLHTTRLTQPELQVVYNVYGDTHLKERELTHLEGYGGARPVRIGNAAMKQLQLDTYGEVVNAVYEVIKRGYITLDHATARLLRGLGETVCRLWREPDNGIWEDRGKRRHRTLSKVMCWVALERLLRLHEAGHLEVPTGRFAKERDAIRAEIETRGFDERLQTYRSSFDHDELDSSLLLLPFYGYVEPTAPRMRATFEHIRKRLGRNGLIYRHGPTEGGSLPDEGAFGVTCFWAVECGARMGAVDAAAWFERLLTYANDVGLYAEEIEPNTGAALGNIPQTYSHIGLVSAALAITGVNGRD